MPSTLGVFTAGAAALTRWEHAGNEGILPSSRARRPRSQACSMQARASPRPRSRDWFLAVQEPAAVSLLLRIAPGLCAQGRVGAQRRVKQ